MINRQKIERRKQFWKNVREGGKKFYTGSVGAAKRVSKDIEEIRRAGKLEISKKKKTTTKKVRKKVRRRTYPRKQGYYPPYNPYSYYPQPRYPRKRRRVARVKTKKVKSVSKRKSTPLESTDWTGLGDFGGF